MARVYGSRRDVGSVTDVRYPATGRYQTDHWRRFGRPLRARAQTARRVGRARHDVISVATVSLFPIVTFLPRARAPPHTSPTSLY